MRPLRIVAGMLAASALWTHVGTHFAAMLYDDPGRAWENLQYISRGFDAVLLYGVIVYLACRAFGLSWDRWWLAVICTACAFAQLMIGVCGVGHWIAGGPDNEMVGLCYAAQSWGPVALVSAAVILVVADTALHTRSQRQR